MKHKLFIGSSVEGIKYARALQRNLAYDSHTRVWNQGIFRASNYILEDLLVALSENDFGAFIFLPEDVSIIRCNREPAVRDNLIFELGLFIGRLGRKRAFFIKPQRCELHLPSDLKGINACEFDPDDPNLVSGTGAAATEIADLMNEIVEKETAGSQRSGDSYDRNAAFEEYLKADPFPLVRGRKYTRNDVITSYGDIRIIEKWEDVTSFNGEPISELQARFTSRAGRQADCKCESLTPNQSVSWTWKPTNNEISESVFVFDPPITSERPISFRTERYVFNGVSFSQQDRLEVTRGNSAEEEFRVSYRHAWESCLFQVKFPEHRFPTRFRASAFDRAGKELLQESECADRCLDPLPETQNLFFKLQRPLHGVKYQINWVLPEDNASLFSDVEQGFVDEVTRRLLGLRMRPGANRQVEDALANARSKIVKICQAHSTGPFQVALFQFGFLPSPALDFRMCLPANST